MKGKRYREKLAEEDMRDEGNEPRESWSRGLLGRVITGAKSMRLHVSSM